TVSPAWMFSVCGENTFCMPPTWTNQAFPDALQGSTARPIASTAPTSDLMQQKPVCSSACKTNRIPSLGRMLQCGSEQDNFPVVSRVTNRYKAGPFFAQHPRWRGSVKATLLSLTLAAALGTVTAQAGNTKPVASVSRYLVVFKSDTLPADAAARVSA